MSEACWFKPKKIGYGAAPTTSQGRAVTAGSALIVWASVAAITSHGNSTAIPLTSFTSIVIATTAMPIVGVKKTEGRWGKNAGPKQIYGKYD